MAKHRILVVEDESALSALLVGYLENEGYAVFAAETAAAAMRLLNARTFDLIVLDIKLPDEDGRVLARQVRTRVDVPIVFITERREKEVRLSALELGGDDFLPKPIDPRELAFRIRNLLRRTAAGRHEAEAHQRYRLAGYVMDMDARSIISEAAGTEIDLTCAQFNILSALVCAKGRVLSRAQLLDCISRVSDDTKERTVDVLISRIRMRLKASGPHGTLIKTVINVGYKLGVPVEQA